MLPTPSTSSQGTRSRRTQASSSSDQQAPRQFGISNVKYRVGAPPLRPFPLRNKYTAPFGDAVRQEDEQQLRTQIEEDAQDLLTQRGILSPRDEYDAEIDNRVMLVKRMIPNVLESAELTLFIVAPWSEASRVAWENAVRDLKTEIDKQLIEQGRGFIDITVEMCAPELVQHKYIYPVVGQPAMEVAWPEVLNKVCDTLESFMATRSCMTSVSLLRLGYSAEHAQNPITLYVSLDYDSDETHWPPVIRKLQDDLVQVGWNEVHIHLEHGVVDGHAFELVPPTVVSDPFTVIEGEYPQRVNMGMDIGAAQYIDRKVDKKRCYPGLGTLGCYVQIKTKSNPVWTTYALTNHHVIRPAIHGFQLMKDSKTGFSVPVPPLLNTALHTADNKGRGPVHITDGANVPIESPSRKKHNHTIQALDDKLELFPADTGTLTKRASKLSFFDEGRNILGEVWASSGFVKRTPDATKLGLANPSPLDCRRLDWALIQVQPTREGANVLPSFDVWAAKYPKPDRPNVAGMTGNLKPPGTSSLKTMASGTVVFKIGARTGVTAGGFNGFTARTSLTTDSYINTPRSTEYICVGREYGANNPLVSFSEQGDSGSVVFDAEGRAVGLLVSGRVPQQATEGFTIVTPIEDVFGSIIEDSGGQVTGVRIAI